MPTLSAEITTGHATFLGDSVNAGTIHGNATFKDNSVNSGTVSNDATFKHNSQNKGTVGGNATFEDDSSNGEKPAPNDDPPLICHWFTSSSAGGNKRRLICTGERNPDQLSETIYGGPWQNCPSSGCFKDPATYRPLAEVNYVLDYERYPHYEQE